MTTQLEVHPKFKALVHFVIHKCAEPDRLGAVRLNKTLWFADVLAYKDRGVSISGTTYIKKQHGPVPKFMPACIEALADEGSITVEEPSFAYETRKFRSMAPPDTSCLDTYEKDLTLYVLNTLFGHTASDVSEMSHDRIWGMASDGEEIPIFATLGSVRGQVTPEVIDWAKSQY